jgi:hypothetical protein
LTFTRSSREDELVNNWTLIETVFENYLHFRSSLVESRSNFIGFIEGLIMRISRKFVYLTVLLTLIAGAEFASAKAKPKPLPTDDFIYTVIHAIPSGYGADVVDIYADTTMIIDNATPGTIKSFTTSHNNLTIRIYANGVVPSGTTSPILSSSVLMPSRGTTLSFVAHLNEIEQPRLSTYKDVVTRAGIKRSWLTVRHVAAAPAVQFRINGSPTFIPITNTVERKRSLPFGLYTLGATYPETSTIVTAATPFEMKAKTNEVIYLWGAKSKSNLGFLRQEIMTK